MSVAFTVIAKPTRIATATRHHAEKPLEKKRLILLKELERRIFETSS